MEASVPNVEDSHDTNDARSVTVFSFQQERFSKLDDIGVTSPPCTIHNIRWRILIKKTLNYPNTGAMGLGLYLCCDVDPENTSWSCHATFKLSVVPHVSGRVNFSQKFQHTFTNDRAYVGCPNIMDWNCFIIFHTVKFRAEVNADSPLGIPSDCEKLASPVNLKNHKIFSETESFLQNLSAESKMDLKRWAPLATVNQSMLDKVRLAYVYGYRGQDAIIITEDDEVWACCTSSSCGRLFRRCTSSQHATEALMCMVDVLNKQGIKGLSANADSFGRYPFLVVCTSSGNVIQLRSPKKWKDDTEIIPISELGCLPKISEVACGFEHCLALSTTGQVFSWGSNEYGQIGSGDTSIKHYDIPYEIENGLKNKCVVNISCGLHFSVVVLEDGRVYTWGKDDVEGEIDKCQFLPVRVPFNEKIQEIVCGHFHVLALSKNFQLYAWGMNDRGQLGLGDYTLRSVPTGINIAPFRYSSAVGIATSCKTSAALTRTGDVYMWGDCLDAVVLTPMKTAYKSLMEVFADYGTPPVTYKPIIRQPQRKSAKSAESVSESIRRAFNDETTSNLIIKADDKEIFVHRSILRVRSDYFRVLLQDQWTNENQKTLEVNLPYDAIYSYLQYLYTGDFEADEEMTQELLILADEYQDLSFKELCEERVERQITIDNIGILFPLALKLKAARLRESCISFASKCISKVVATPAFQKWDKDALMEFIAECNKKELFKT